jgi:hypothetical protein
LLLYAERALLALADHHAITGASTSHDWAIVPSYADLWIERRGGYYVVEAVREGSPAALAGIVRGDRLTGAGGTPIAAAVQDFWDDLGLPVTDERAGFAARILAAGRRDSPRRLELQRGSAPPRTVELPNLYQLPHPPRPPVATRREGAALVIRFNDSLGDDSTIAAFDGAMAAARPRQPVIVDLTDTPSGGNTVVARAVLGWFVEPESPANGSKRSCPGPASATPRPSSSGSAAGPEAWARASRSASRHWACRWSAIGWPGCAAPSTTSRSSVPASSSSSPPSASTPSPACPASASRRFRPLPPGE